MSITVMKQALEALEHGLDYAKSEQFENAQRYKGYECLAPDDAHSIQLIETAITSLRQAIAYAEKQKPVELVSKTPPLYPMQKEGETFSVEYYEIDTQPKRERVVFPTMLRKMWSGGEVQAWIDENVNKEKNT